MRQKHGGTQHHKGGVLVSAFSSASAAATSAAFSPLHVVFVVDMAGDSPIIVPARSATMPEMIKGKNNNRRDGTVEGTVVKTLLHGNGSSKSNRDLPIHHAHLRPPAPGTASHPPVPRG